MIQIKEGNKKEAFVTYIEQALKSLSHEDYDAFLSSFDTSRLSKDALILALRYLDETRPVIKIDDPIMRNSEQDIYPKTGRRLRLQRRQVSWNTHSAPFGRECSNMKSSSLFSRLFLSQYST